MNDIRRGTLPPQVIPSGTDGETSFPSFRDATRFVVALGGNALLQRGQPMTAGIQRENIRKAARALAPIATSHQLVLSHGNGPQVGLLSLQQAAYQHVLHETSHELFESYPFDLLGAETEGMIGYMIEQELGNLLPDDLPIATILTMVEVDPHDPGFKDPSKFIGPLYGEKEAKKILQRKAGFLNRMEISGVVSFPPPDRSGSGRSGRLHGCLNGVRLSFVQEGEGSLLYPEPVLNKGLPAWKGSSTKTWPADCWRETLAQTCSSWSPIHPGCTSIIKSRMPC